jgi:hypothetical protein
MPRKQLFSTTAPIPASLPQIPVSTATPFQTGSSSLSATPPCGAYSIILFCRAHHISEAFYHKLKRQGLGPVEMVVGTRRLISVESAAAWRRAREVAASASAASA